MAAAAGAGQSVSVPITATEKPDPAKANELTDERIAERAYSYWEARGFDGGSPEDDWYRAIEELTAEHIEE